MEKFIINNQWLELSDIQSILENKRKIELGEAARKAIIDCSNYLDSKIQDSDSLIYKIKTGVFGADMQISLINDGPVTIMIDSKARE